MKARDIDVGSLYEAIRAQQAKTRATPAVRDLPPTELRAYRAAAGRQHRAAVREAAAAGDLKPTAPNIRAVLADAALLLLATGGPGSAEIERMLGTAFSSKPGVALTVVTKARSGKLRPKVIGRR